MSNPVLVVQDSWHADVQRVMALPRYDRVRGHGPAVLQRYARGLLAERALIAYLLSLADRSVRWLSNEAQQYQSDRTGGPRSIIGDVEWCGRQLDAKLIKRHESKLYVKFGAQHIDHVYMCWEPSEQLTFRVLGVLHRAQPETFGPPIELTDPSFNRPMISVNSNRTVRGWAIPRARLQPLTSLLQETT